MFARTLGLIPRYNWDMKLADLIEVLRAPLRRTEDQESVFRKVLGCRPVLTGSGRAALYLILKALGLPEGARVGVPLFCCSVVFEAVRRAGLVPRFLDINLDDFSISAVDLKRKRDDIAAVVAVHMFGHPADMDAVREASAGLPVIEDCAHSLFSRYKGRLTGFLAEASFFTFRSGKYVSAGEGGAVFARDQSLLSNIGQMAGGLEPTGLAREMLHGMSTYVKSRLYRRPWYGAVGKPLGSLLDRQFNLSAKTGLELRRIRAGNLALINKRLPAFHQRVLKQRENSMTLLKRLRIKNASLPMEREDTWSNYYQFAVLLDTQERRDRLASRLLSAGVDAARYLDGVAEECRRDYGYDGDCPNSESAAERTLVIPNHYTLSGRDLDQIVEAVNRSGV